MTIHIFTHRRGLVALLLVLLVGGPGLAATTFQNLISGTTTTVITFSSLANNARSSPGTMYDPRQGQTGLGYMNVVVVCDLTFAAAPTSGTAVSVWFAKSLDGTTFEDSTTSRVPDIVCPVTPSQVGTRVSFYTRLPALRFRAVALNDGTGQTISSGTVSVTPVTTQGN